MVDPSTDAAPSRAEVVELEAKVAELQARVDVLERRTAPREFVVGQYNILAGYLGDNRQPWFMYGCDIAPERRKQIMQKFYEKDESGRFANAGWPKYVTGILTAEEIATVETVHKQHFAWEVRKAAVLETMLNLDADLLSLVELDEFDEYFKPALDAKGYDAVWKKRPRASSADGCAIVYRRGIFSLVATHSIEFVDRTDSATGAAVKDRVALLALLKHVTGRQLIFVSTHLARNPEDPRATKSRAKQAAQLFQGLTEFASEHGALATPVVVAGDMNTTSIKKVASIARCVFELSGKDVHPFIFSANAPRTLPTSVTTTRKMCIDYILLQASLTVVDRPALPMLSEGAPIPNAEHPSDHVPISFRLSFQQEESRAQAAAKGWALMLLEDPHAAGGAPLTAADLRAAFGFFDIEEDGCWAFHELEAALLDLGMLDKLRPLRAAVEREVGHSLDGVVGGGKALDFGEFVSAYQSSFMRSKAAFKRDMQDAFAYFDSDRSGKLDKAELHASFAAACPFPVDAALFDEMFAQLDSDGDGIVTMDEFTDYLMTRFASKAIAAEE